MVERILQIYKNSEKKNYTIEEMAKILGSEASLVKKEFSKLVENRLIYKNTRNSYRLNTYFPTEEEKNEIKSQILKIISSKRIATFRNIVSGLRFKKKEEIIFLRDFLKVLEKNEDIYHNKSRGFYSIEKINYLSKDVLEEQITKILNKYPSVSYKKLRAQLHLTRDDNEYLLITLLQELECNGKVFIKNNYYQKMPINYKVANVLDFWGGGNLLCRLENEDTLVKVPLENANGILKYDTVILSLNGSTNEYKVEKIIKRQNSKLVCEVVLDDDNKVLKPYHMLSNLKPRISSNDMKNVVVGDLVLISLTNEEADGYYEAYFEKIVGNINDPDIDLKCIALNYGFTEEFSPEAILEANQIPIEVEEADLKDRVDLRNETIVTIDDETCKDMDDAISLELLPDGNYKLGVHIADVSHYIKPNSALYQEAKSRGTSLYMINTSIPMLPRILTNGILSLNPGVNRLTITCEMIISKEGQVIDYKIFNSVIKSKKKMSYKEVNKVIKGNASSDYKPFERMIFEMQKLSLILSKNKNDRGYLEFASLESKFQEDAHGKVIAINKRQQLDAEKIIENFMILANETVDTHLFWLGLPKLSRTHDEPDEERLSSVLEIIKLAGYKIKIDKTRSLAEQIHDILISLRCYEEFPVLSNMILKCMSRASYTTNMDGHFGLKLNHYMHFTSPIRRYPDLETHTLLKLYHSEELENVNLDVLASDLKIDAEYSSNRERMADQAEAQAVALKNVEFYENLIGHEVIGNITSFTYKRIMVQTRDDLVDGVINIEDIETSNLGKHGNRSLDYRIRADHLRIGSKVLLVVKEVDKEEKLVHFILKKNLSWKHDEEMIRTLKKPEFD